MFKKISDLFGSKTVHKGGPMLPEVPMVGTPAASNAFDRRPVFSKVFRWRLPSGQTKSPETVEVVGSFTHWRKVPLVNDGILGAWHVTLHHIQGNRTHHYMLLLDGKPTFDKDCDGLAIPRGLEEEAYQLVTDKGPRVMMLFAQTK